MKILKKILPFVGIVIFVLLVGKVGVGKISVSLKQAKTSFLVVAFGLNFVCVFLQILKWEVVLKRLKIKASFLELLKLYLVGYFYAAVSPGRVGVMMKAYYLKEKTGKSLTKSSLSVMIDWTFGLLVTYLVALFGVVFLFGSMLGERVMRVILVGVLALMTWIMFLLFGKGKKFLYFWLDFIPMEAVKKKVFQVLEGMHEEKFTFKDFTTILMINLSSYTMGMIRAYFLVLASGIGLSFWTVAASVSLVLTFVFLPVTVSGLGISQLGYVFLWLQFGVEPAAAISFTLLGYLVVIIPQALLGWIASLGYARK